MYIHIIVYTILLNIFSIHIYTYVYQNVHIYIYIYTLLYMSIYIYIYICITTIYAYICKYAEKQFLKFTHILPHYQSETSLFNMQCRNDLCLHTFIYIYIYTHMITFTRAYIHIHGHTYIHA